MPPLPPPSTPSYTYVYAFIYMTVRCHNVSLYTVSTVPVSQDQLPPGNFLQGRENPKEKLSPQSEIPRKISPPLVKILLPRTEMMDKISNFSETDKLKSSYWTEASVALFPGPRGTRLTNSSCNLTRTLG